MTLSSYILFHMMSSPSRGTWIEIGYDGALSGVVCVVPLTGDVD